MMPSAPEFNALRYFWGKARPAAQVGTQAAVVMHPLIAHMLDVAAVAISLPGSSERLGLDKRQLGMLVALHDIGKLSPAFQKKVPQCWPEQAFGFFTAAIEDGRHDVEGITLLDLVCQGVLAPLFGENAEGEGWSAADKAQLWRAIAGHHGVPVATKNGAARKFKKAPVAVYACALVEVLRDVFKPPPLQPLPQTVLQKLEWQLAGLTVQADWVGSRQEWFPYVTPNEVADPCRYFWNNALPCAQAALVCAGLAPVGVAPFQGIAHLFAHIKESSPVQALLQTVALPTGPTLLVVEDMTGSGKTEAALLAAHRFMAAGHATGLFVALPTMATANAMFDRLAGAYRGLFHPSSHPSLALAHGRAALDARFAAVIAPEDTPNLSGLSEEGGKIEAAEVCCSAWLGGEARRALLAQVGVGTLDQALLAVLPKRFATIRQAGLAGKVLLVDECHAYDPYMQEEMLALLRFHAAMGGSVVLLSATLTQAVRQKLVNAFRQGLDQYSDPVEVFRSAYPLVTLVSGAGVRELPCMPRLGLARRVAVCRVPDEASVFATITQDAAKGAAVAWVRNTVNDVIAAARALVANGVEVQVFHARFAMIDRLSIESAVLARFGKDSTPTERVGVLVASQVIEQSLDIDFDVLCTDLAPMDLIIQRAGRLRRHARPARPVENSPLYVLAPNPVENPDPNWLARLLPGSAAVYQDHALLWRTARVLEQAGEIRSPEAVRALIEAAAGAEGHVPDGFEKNYDNAVGDGLSKVNHARRVVLNFESGYTPDVTAWAGDERIGTRLDERPQVTVRLAVLKEGQVHPWAALQDETLASPRERKRAWALSEVSVARYHLALCPNEPQVQKAVTAARAEWSRWEREAEEQFLILILRSNGTGWEGYGCNEAGAEVMVHYDPHYGLEIELYTKS